MPSKNDPGGPNLPSKIAPSGTNIAREGPFLFGKNCFLILPSKFGSRTKIVGTKSGKDRFCSAKIVWGGLILQSKFGPRTKIVQIGPRTKFDYDCCQRRK